MDYLTELLKDFELKTAKDSSLITKTSERLSTHYSLKYNTELLNKYMTLIPLKSTDVWACAEIFGTLSNYMKDVVLERLLTSLPKCFHKEFTTKADCSDYSLVYEFMSKIDSGVPMVFGDSETLDWY